MTGYENKHKFNTHTHTMALSINITTSAIKFHYNLSCYTLLTEIIHLYNIKCQHSARTAPTLSICSEDYIYTTGFEKILTSCIHIKLAQKHILKYR